MDQPGASLFCTKCDRELPASIAKPRTLTPCPSCGVKSFWVLFPAFHEVKKGRAGESLLVDTDAGCFYHPQKKAELACEYCGRFICALCDVEIEGKHLCPPCVESGKQKGRLKSLDNHRVLYDSVAFTLAVLPLAVVVFIYFTFITAPIALFMAIRFWNAPTGILHRSKWRMVVAILISSLEIAGWVALVYFLITRGID